MSQKHQYKADIRWSDEDDAYIAKVPELSGVITHGDTSFKSRTIKLKSTKKAAAKTKRSAK